MRTDLHLDAGGEGFEGLLHVSVAVDDARPLRLGLLHGHLELQPRVHPQQLQHPVEACMRRCRHVLM